MFIKDFFSSRTLKYVTNRFNCFMQNIYKIDTDIQLLLPISYSRAFSSLCSVNYKAYSVLIQGLEFCHNSFLCYIKDICRKILNHLEFRSAFILRLLLNVPNEMVMHFCYNTSSENKKYTFTPMQKEVCLIYNYVRTKRAAKQLVKTRNIICSSALKQHPQNAISQSLLPVIVG